MDSRIKQENKLQELDRFLKEQIDMLQALIADDGKYIPVRYFQGKLQAYSMVKYFLEGDEEE